MSKYLQEGSSYAEKMDSLITGALKDWWSGLSKQELLTYIAEQPAISAEDLRKMIANVNGVLAFDIRYSTKEKEATTDFHAVNPVESE